MKKINWKLVCPLIAIFAFATFLVTFCVDFSRLIKGLDEYCGVSRTDSRSVILYRLGTPGFVANPGNATYYSTLIDGEYVREREGPRNLVIMPSNSKVGDYSSWRYRRGDSFLAVGFEESGQVASVSCSVGFGRDCPPLLGVRLGDTEEDIAKTLGKPEWQKIEGTTKAVAYDAYGVIFFLEKERVYDMTLLGMRRDNSVVFKYFLRNYL